VRVDGEGGRGGGGEEGGGEGGRGEAHCLEVGNPKQQKLKA